MTQELTKERIQELKNEIMQMSHIELVRRWRFAPIGDEIFSNLELSALMKHRLFQHFGGITPEISKEVGWE